MAEKNGKRPLPITVLAILLVLFGIFAFAGSVFLWGQGFVLNPPEGASIAFPITDILVNAPASILAGIGLWRLRRYGFLAAYFVAGFYVYASVYIFAELFEAGPPYPVEILVPQILAVLVAIGLLIYPGQFRDRFG